MHQEIIFSYCVAKQPSPRADNDIVCHGNGDDVIMQSVNHPAIPKMLYFEGMAHLVHQ